MLFKGPDAFKLLFSSNIEEIPLLSVLILGFLITGLNKELFRSLVSIVN